MGRDASVALVADGSRNGVLNRADSRQSSGAGSYGEIEVREEVRA